jgi:hypothetical protein
VSDRCPSSWATFIPFTPNTIPVLNNIPNPEAQCPSKFNQRIKPRIKIPKTKGTFKNKNKSKTNRPPISSSTFALDLGRTCSNKGMKQKATNGPNQYPIRLYLRSKKIRVGNKKLKR